LKFPQVAASLTVDAYVFGDTTVPGAIPSPQTGAPAVPTQTPATTLSGATAAAGPGATG
jgi:hypothetical protein